MKEKKTTLEKVKEQLKKEMLSYTNRDWIKLILLIAFTILIGSLAVSYLLDVVYEINLGTDPCGLCRKLNPNIKIITNEIGINWSNFSLGLQLVATLLL